MPNNDKMLRGGHAGQRPELLRKTAVHIMTFILGFLLAGTPLMGMYPFGAALISAVGYDCVFTAALGAVASCLFPPDGGSLHILAAALAACAVRRTLSEFRMLSSKPFYPSAAAFISVSAGRTVSAVHYGGTAWTGIVSALCEAMLAAACAYFFSQCRAAFESVPGGGSVLPDIRRFVSEAGRLTIKQKGSCLFTVCVFLVPLCRLKAGGFSPFSIVVLLAAVLAARRLSPPEACLLGTASGAVLSAASGNISYAGICAAAALISSLFAPLSGILCAGAFSAVCVGASLSRGGIDVFFIIEALLAAGAGAAVPYAWLRADGGMYRDVPAGEEPAGTAAPPSVPAADAAVSGRLYFTARRLRAAAEGLSDISAQVLEASSRLDRLDAEDSGCRNGVPSVCVSCGLSACCWEELAPETAESIRAINDKFDSGTPVTDALSVRCPRWGELVASMEKEHRERAERERVRLRISRVRAAVSDQLCRVSDLLNVIAAETAPGGSSEDVSPSDERRVFEIFDRFCYDLSDVHISFGKNGRFAASLGPGAVSRERLADIMQALSETFGAAFDIDESSGGGTALITRAAPLKAVFGTCQAAKSGAQLCGDSFSSVTLGSGSAAIVLSDGMGTGGRAAIDAAMTCGLMKRLLLAGFDARGAMGMVNSALMLRAEDEPLATVDCLLIDLFSGNAAIEKAGAAASFVRQGGRVRRIDPESLPLGIMDSVDSARAGLALDEGDVILMVSDGVISDGSCGWIEDMLSGCGDNMRELACSVVERAGETSDDDLTAVAVRIQKNGDI